MPIARINNHDMYYEVHGEGDPLVCTGGWGTFCHGEEKHVPRGLTDQYSVMIFLAVCWSPRLPSGDVNAILFFVLKESHSLGQLP